MKFRLMSSRSSHLVVTIVVAALVASASAWAAATVTSRSIQDNTIQSRDVKNGTLRAVDISAAARSTFTAIPAVPHVEVRRHAAVQSVPSAAVTAISFDTVDENHFGMFDAAQPTHLVAPSAGLYLVEAAAYWPTTSATSLELYITASNSAGTQRGFTAGPNGGSAIISGSGVVRLAAGNYVRIHVRQDSGVAAALDTNYTYATMTRIGS